jgi:hypothetical protein
MAIQRSLALLLCSSIALSACAPAYAYPPDQNEPVVWSPSTPGPQQISVTSNVQSSTAQLQQLVAPIALYPDSLVAQVLAASTYPAEVVEAQRWMTQHQGLTAQQRADEVNKLSWDPSIKSLIAFPSVLANMDKNLSWTSSLGQAYVQNPQEVMNTIQQLRQSAQNAGHLSSTSQETVTTQGQDIVIQPVDPEVVYVPEYDPWLVYGPPLVAWPGWYGYPGLYLGTPGIFFGVGIGIGAFAAFGWGWHHWGFDWAHRAVMFNHHTFISRSRTVIDRRTTINRQFRGDFHHVAAADHHFAGVHHFGGFNHFAGAAHFHGFHHFAGGFRMAGGFHGGGRR